MPDGWCCRLSSCLTPEASEFGDVVARRNTEAPRSRAELRLRNELNSPTGSLSPRSEIFLFVWRLRGSRMPRLIRLERSYRDSPPAWQWAVPERSA